MCGFPCVDGLDFAFPHFPLFEIYCRHSKKDFHLYFSIRHRWPALNPNSQLPAPNSELPTNQLSWKAGRFEVDMKDSPLPKSSTFNYRLSWICSCSSSIAAAVRTAFLGQQTANRMRKTGSWELEMGKNLVFGCHSIRYRSAQFNCC